MPSGKKKREDDNHLIEVREDYFTTVYQQRNIKLATTCEKSEYLCVHFDRHFN